MLSNRSREIMLEIHKHCSATYEPTEEEIQAVATACIGFGIATFKYVYGERIGNIMAEDVFKRMLSTPLPTEEELESGL